MVTIRAHESDGHGRARRCLAKVAGLALGITMLGTIGLSGTLAQEEDVTAGAADADAIVNSLIEQIFAEIFGGDVAEDEAAVSGGDLNVGGNMGGSVIMGGGSGGVSVGGGSGGGIAVGDDTGG